MAADPRDVPPGWVGRKPPVPCEKQFGICGYINCKKEGRCLQVRHVKRPVEEA